ncbi:cobalamin B12-binding domain-containing protein [Bacillus coahuilensis]|uniref:cobalamin B12-binding domain-containing protein n=1 Tax=Bacillus coahuilensis TaxID=408580 RepID=UPI0007506239|nr:cobalamin B12-binding domain-containing protein [Bacillus coahuilensis]
MGKNKITVAEEHLVTASMDYVISSFFQMPYFHKEKRQKPRIVLSCVEREEHSLGIKMVGRVFEEYKWDVKLLGANLPKEYLLHAINVWNPKMVGLSLSTPALIPELVSTVREIKQKSPNTHILVGGRLSEELQQMKEMEGVQLCNSLHHLKDFIQNQPLENV